MFGQKLTPEARKRLRAQRAEAHLIKERANKRAFDYLVKPAKKTSLAFGTALERVTLPLSGPHLNSFMRQRQLEVRAAPGPQDYAVSKALGKEFPSKLGFSSFVSKVPRFMFDEISPYPPIGAYNIAVEQPFKAAAKPFGIGAKRAAREALLTPAPSAYSLRVAHKSPKISAAFGSKRVILPAVTVICTIEETALCHKCGLAPSGDYWRDFAAELDMCRACMQRERAVLDASLRDVLRRLHLERRLAQFVPVRHCSFYHDHQGTKAAVQVKSTKSLRFRIKQENYLHSYNVN